MPKTIKKAAAKKKAAPARVRITVPPGFTSFIYNTQCSNGTLLLQFIDHAGFYVNTSLIKTLINRAHHNGEAVTDSLISTIIDKEAIRKESDEAIALLERVQSKATDVMALTRHLVPAPPPPPKQDTVFNVSDGIGRPDDGMSALKRVLAQSSKLSPEEATQAMASIIRHHTFETQNAIISDLLHEIFKARAENIEMYEKDMNFVQTRLNDAKASHTGLTEIIEGGYTKRSLIE